MLQAARQDSNESTAVRVEWSSAMAKLVERLQKWDTEKIILVSDQSSLEKRFIDFEKTVQQKWDNEVVGKLREILHAHLKGSVSVQFTSVSNG